MKAFWGVIVLLTLVAVAGCSPAANDPVLPVPAITDTYMHPSGVFSLPVPASWAVGDLSDHQNLLVTFAPSGAERPLLTAFVVRLSGPLDSTGFGAAMGSYLRTPYNAGLNIVEQTAVEDGSWRAVGVRNIQEEALPVNVFMGQDGVYFTVLEVVVPVDEPVTSALLTTMVNEFSVNQNAEWPIGAVDAIPEFETRMMVAEGNITFEDIATWTDDLGQFHITGQLANHNAYAVEQIRVQGTLSDAYGTRYAALSVDVPVPFLLDRAYAPFDVVFPDGRPATASRYHLEVTAQQAANTLYAFSGAGSFDWDDRATYDDQGRLHIQGTLWHVGLNPLYKPQAVVTLFNTEDVVIGYVDAILTDGAMQPEESIPFDVAVPDLGGEPVRYQLTVYAQNQP